VYAIREAASGLVEHRHEVADAEVLILVADGVGATVRRYPPGRGALDSGGGAADEEVSARDGRPG
jgi:hypothetical protein